MSERPMINKNMSSETFREYYYLKEELVSFCREMEISARGNKGEITDRISYYLDTGKEKEFSRAKLRTASIEMITEESKIEDNFVCSERHRAFFENKIGATFSFLVIFQKWLKNNTGKTYKEAIEAYYKILEEKKKSKTKIDPQFEYNTYIRDFFNENKGKTLAEAIQCWKYKKSMKGHNRYEKKDLIVLK